MNNDPFNARGATGPFATGRASGSLRPVSALPGQGHASGDPLQLTAGEKKSLFWQTNLAIFCIFIINLLLIFFVCFMQQGENRAVWYLILVAMGGAGAGCIAGFIYACYGQENARFAPLLSLVNGFLGGASIADLSHGRSSVILRGLRSMAVACGLKSSAIMAAAAIGFFGIGFIGMYWNRKLLFNALTAEQDRFVDAMVASVERVANSSIQAPGGLPPRGGGPWPQGPTGGGGPPGGGAMPQVVAVPTLPPETRQAAAELRSKGPASLQSTDEIVAWAKAQLDGKKYGAAAAAFARALLRRPNDPELLLGHGLAMFYGTTDAPRRAQAIYEIENAETHIGPETDPDVVKNIYKALTYCSLYQPGGFENAIRAGEKYLNITGVPRSGAVLANLAAAYGQRHKSLQSRHASGQDLEQAGKQAASYIRQAIAFNPAYRQLFMRLSNQSFPGKDPKEDDLETLADNADVRAAIKISSPSEEH